MKQPLLLLFLGTILMITSCKEDEEVRSELKYEGNTFLFSDCLQEDWGGHTGTHYNMDFTVVGESSLFVKHTDVFGRDYYLFSEDIDFYVFMELFSPGTEEFTPGSFRFLGSDPFADITDEFVFRRFWFGSEPGEIIKAVNGTIHLAIGKDGNFHFNFDILLENGNRLTGSFSGIPKYAVGR